MRTREIERERSTTWLRNRGVGREMLRLIQGKGAPVRRIFCQLAELGVPCSMAEELIGHRLQDWASCKPVHEAKLQALWSLAEAYTDVANCEPGAVEGLDDVVLEAQRFGVYYDPPSCTAVVIERRARKLARFVEYEKHVKPGRSFSHDRFWRDLMRGVPQVDQLHEVFRQVVELRLELMTTHDIARRLGRTERVIRTILRREDVIKAIEEVRPLADIEADMETQRRQRQAEATARNEANRRKLEARVRAALKAPDQPAQVGRPMSLSFDEVWVRAELARGRSLHSIAIELRISKQALSYRLGRRGAS